MLIYFGYPHAHEDAWVDQHYLPDTLTGRSWYRPTTHGHEQVVAEAMQSRIGRAASDGHPPSTNEYYPR